MFPLTPQELDQTCTVLPWHPIPKTSWWHSWSMGLLDAIFLCCVDGTEITCELKKLWQTWSLPVGSLCGGLEQFAHSLDVVCFSILKFVFSLQPVDFPVVSYQMLHHCASPCWGQWCSEFLTPELFWGLKCNVQTCASIERMDSSTLIMNTVWSSLRGEGCRTTISYQQWISLITHSFPRWIYRNSCDTFWFIPITNSSSLLSHSLSCSPLI